MSEQLATAGSSAGGEMTAILALMAKDNGGPELEFQLMPWSAWAQISRRPAIRNTLTVTFGLENSSAATEHRIIQ